MRPGYTARGFAMTRGRMTKRWRPASEAEAASDTALFIEWLRATGLAADAGPERFDPAWLEAYLAGGEPVRSAAIRRALGGR